MRECSGDGEEGEGKASDYVCDTPTACNQAILRPSVARRQNILCIQRYAIDTPLPVALSNGSKDQ